MIATATLLVGVIAFIIDSPESPELNEPDQTTTTTIKPAKAILIPPVTEEPEARQPVQTPETLPQVELLPVVPVVPEPEPVVEPDIVSGVADVAYWDRMAQCETGGNWQHFPYGTWTGGLGIYNQTWIGWGGGEFAPTAGQATKEQQIIVADRIAADVGYSAWGCVATVGYP